jgi:hypothetical protein
VSINIIRWVFSTKETVENFISKPKNDFEIDGFTKSHF